MNTMKTQEYPIVRKCMKMLIGSFSIPTEVKKIFAENEDEATADVWFTLLENEFLCQYILAPELKPKALTTAVLALTQNQEIQEQLDNTTFAYLQYAVKKYNSNKALKFFYQNELNIRFKKKTTKLASQKIYARVVNWLEKNLEHDVMLDHAEEIADLMKVIIFTKSAIMNEESFQELFYEKRLDLIALM